MFQLINFDIIDILTRAIAVLLAISIHEMAHGYAAYFLGDKTAKSMGRLSLNPLKHLDPIGAVCLLFFGFGWAKPVVVNPYCMKKPKRDMALVALAGPLTNFVLAFLGLLLYKLIFSSGIFYMIGFAGNISFSFLQNFIFLNIGLGTFNLIPIPPLDGSKIFLSLFPSGLYRDIMRYERYGFYILIFALVTGVVNNIVGRVGSLIFSILSFLVGGV